MDRDYIEQEHIVDRYLNGDLTVREAREFEKYCRDNPDFLGQLPIPVRLKARLARHPGAASETGMFQAIPSSAARVAMEVNDEGFDAAQEQDEWRRRYAPQTSSRLLSWGLGIALILALGGVVTYGMRASELTQQLKQQQRAARQTQLQAPAGVQSYKLQLTPGKPAQATLVLGWMQPPQLLELSIDTTGSRYSQFQITIDKIDGGRIMQIRRMASDSNKQVRLGLNSSAFGPGEYLLQVDGYTWRGQLEPVGWARLGLE